MAGIADADKLDGDALHRSAVIQQLLIIGEATKQLSMEFRNQHAEIPWRAMAGMRDVLIHAYRGVEIDEVWAAATVAVPELIRRLEPLIPPVPENTDPGEPLA